jgi:glucose/arabinose dehydrogenase
MKTTTSSTALALLLGLGLALPAAAQQQQQQQPAAQQGQQGQQTQQGQQQPTTAQPGQQQGQEMQAEATIATVDQTSLKVSTQEGDEYTLAEGNLIAGLQPGQKVRITFMEQGDQKRVTHIEPVQQ